MNFSATESTLTVEWTSSCRQRTALWSECGRELCSKHSFLPSSSTLFFFFFFLIITFLLAVWPHLPYSLSSSSSPSSSLTLDSFTASSSFPLLHYFSLLLLHDFPSLSLLLLHPSPTSLLMSAEQSRTYLVSTSR